MAPILTSQHVGGCRFSRGTALWLHLLVQQVETDFHQPSVAHLIKLLRVGSWSRGTCDCRTPISICSTDGQFVRHITWGPSESLPRPAKDSQPHPIYATTAQLSALVCWTATHLHTTRKSQRNEADQARFLALSRMGTLRFVHRTCASELTGGNRSGLSRDLSNAGRCDIDSNPFFRHWLPFPSPVPNLTQGF